MDKKRQSCQDVKCHWYRKEERIRRTWRKLYNVTVIKERKEKVDSRHAAQNRNSYGCNVQIRFDSMSNSRSLLHQGLNKF